jgi:pilus assembly protein CpaF
MQDGTRKITAVSELQGMEGDTIVLQNLFEFEQTGYEGGRVVGQYKATGARPKCYEKLQHGIDLPLSVFGRVLLG